MAGRVTSAMYMFHCPLCRDRATKRLGRNFATLYGLRMHNITRHGQKRRLKR